MTQNTWIERAAQCKPVIHNWIAGRSKPTGGDQQITKYSARDGHLLYAFGEGHSVDVETAVVAARAAFVDGRWSRLPMAQRKAVLLKLADLMASRAEELALLECLDVGKPITHALQEDVAGSLHILRSAAEGAEQLLSKASVDGPGPNMVYQVRKPIGVVGAIVGWNYPLVLSVMKMAPALMMGNSLVLKPSEFTALSAARVAELATEAGVPDSVFNVINGAGAVVGDALARHPDVNLLAFTGSSATGKKLMVSAGQSNMKRLLLECGGKSPYLVFDDCADLDFVALHATRTAFRNQGQLCAAATRLVVQESVMDRLIPKLIDQAKKLVPQDPLDPATTFGALMNEPHLRKVLNYIDSGKQDGAELVHAGRRVEPIKGGYYLEPNIFLNVKKSMRIAQEEIFGPVLSIMPFRTEEEAVSIANDSAYGLAASVGTTNLGRAHRLARNLDAGQLVIVGTSTPSAGGTSLGVEPQKESGFGTEGGLDGLAAYAAVNTVRVLV